ncbi:MAG: hypothetical protein GEU97_14910 [Actinophytocola sp.]|nr:hypothetical protein [Actinophytocola sp.]
MYRRAFALAVLLTSLSLLASSVLVAVAVIPTDTATASLEEGGDVHPGKHQAFAVRVSGNSALAGERIDYVSIALPAATAGITVSSAPVTPPDGWTVQLVRTGTAQALKFHATGDTGIARGDSELFTFPADVATPDSDRNGGIGVQVSTNGGQEIDTAEGSPLPTTVRVLEVVSQQASAPRGVVDQSATAGQAITYDVAVRNHASRALPVQPALTSSSDEDQITEVPERSVSAGAVSTFEFPVRLGDSAGTRTFTTGATATDSTALTSTKELLVQSRALLTLTSSTFDPQYVRSDRRISYDFGVEARKSGDPALTVSSCELSFADTSTALSGAPLTLEPGSQTRRLAFTPTTVRGAEGTYDATVHCNGRDDNDKPETYDLSLSQIVTIDNTAPLVEVEELDIPSGQDAVKNGDQITVNGTISGESSSSLEAVQLRTDRGEAIECPNPTRDGNSFECEFARDEITFSPGTEAVRGEARVVDAAGNIGEGRGDADTVVDLRVPELHFAETETGSQFGSQIRVQFAENRVISGGCDTAQWTVAGTHVSRVRYSDGSLCRSGQSGPENAPDNYRILVLSDTLGPDDEPAVTYRPSTLGDHVRDGANNRAARKTVNSVTSIVPQAPQITEVTRSDHRDGEREDAVADGAGSKPDTTTYWTNRPGNDLRVSFAGAKAGYRVQVVDGDAKPLTTAQPVADTSGEVAIPVGNTDGRVVRGIRLINNAGQGAVAYFDVVLDRKAPRIDSAVASQPSAVTGDVRITVTFTDVLAAGRDFASDWWVVARSGNVTQPASVSGSRETRTLSVRDFDEEFGGVQYELSQQDEDTGAMRYEDRAGNLLANASWGSL